MKTSPPAPTPEEREKYRQYVEMPAGSCVILVAKPMGIACLLCGRESRNPNDVKERYCGNCHLFHESVKEARLAHLAGEASHECSDWRTALAFCAVCGANL